MATVKKMKKAQNGKEIQTMGDATKVSANKSKYVSEDGNYKMKFKGGDDNSAPTSAVQRRTLKGFLKGAPKAAGKMKLKSGGKVGKTMLKRADGSTSQRGLWDNIRAAKGSGKKPTAQMLKQEKKIKAKTK
jgi:hypothetical protein